MSLLRAVKRFNTSHKAAGRSKADWGMLVRDRQENQTQIHPDIKNETIFFIFRFFHIHECIRPVYSALLPTFQYFINRIKHVFVFFSVNEIEIDGLNY